MYFIFWRWKSLIAPCVSMRGFQERSVCWFGISCFCLRSIFRVFSIPITRLKTPFLRLLFAHVPIHLINIIVFLFYLSLVIACNHQLGCSVQPIKGFQILFLFSPFQASKWFYDLWAEILRLIEGCVYRGGINQLILV